MKKVTLKTVALLTGVLVVAAGVFFFWSSGSPGAADAASTAAPKPALTVTVAAPQTARLPIRLAANGNIAAWQEAVIGAESSGLRLTEVLVNVGDVVRAGQELARFSTDSVQADVAQARAGLIEAQASAADAAANAERARTLQDSGALSSQQINQYLTAAQTAKARAEAAQAVLDAQQLRSRQTRVLAPDSGVISARTATVGAVVGAGTELFRMIRKGRLEWRAELTSAELGRITVGTAVMVQPASGGELPGRVRMVGPTVDPQTRSALVYVDLPAMTAPARAATSVGANERSQGPPRASSAPSEGSAVRAATSVGAAERRDGPPQASSTPSGGSAVRAATSVGANGRSEGPPRASPAPSGGSAVRAATSVGAALPGMFARGEFELGASSALTVPQRAIVVRDGFNYVFRLGPDNRVGQVKVQTGRLAGDRVEIIAGLAADARIAIDGAGFLNDGDLVRVAEAPGAAPAAPK